MKDFSVRLSDRPGELAQVATALSRYGVNIKALAGLAIDGETALDDVDDLPVMRDGHSPGCFHCPQDIILVNRPPGDSHNSTAVYRSDMRASQADQSRGDLETRRRLGFLDRLRDRLRRRRQVHDHPLADAVRWLDAHAEDADGFVILHAPDQRTDFGCANIDSYNNFIHKYLHRWSSASSRDHLIP